jgi:Family of unknown function (DUF6295)
MCTGIVENAKVAGCAKGREGWFDLEEVHVSYDHPYNAPFEHTVNLDFVRGEETGDIKRVAVELDAESARKLVRAIVTSLSRGGIDITHSFKADAKLSPAITS